MNPVRAAVLAAGFRRRGPWVTRFEIGGRPFGGTIPFATDERLAAFVAAFPGARRILELGALEGGHTFALAARPGVEVVAVEGRRENVERARFVQRVLGAGNVRFVHADVAVTGPDAWGEFDAVLCSGLLYHLGRPWALVDRLRAAAPGVFLWTHVAPAARDVHPLDGTPGEWRRELWRDDPTVGLDRRSFWPTLDALVDRLRARGFPVVEVTEHDTPGAPAATIVARDPAA